jgi:hypothetical protein
MSGPRRVLLLNERDPLHPQAGGAEVHVAEISRRTRQVLDGMTVRRLGPLPLYYPRVVAATAWATRRGHFDVVVEHLNKVPFCARAYAGAPVIAVNHHLFGDSSRWPGPSPPRS